MPDSVSQADPADGADGGAAHLLPVRQLLPDKRSRRKRGLPDSNRIEFGEETTYSKAPGATDTAFTVNVIDPAG